MKYEIYSGAGNAFVMINNWDGAISLDKQKELTIKLCGEDYPLVDGVIFLDKPETNNASIRMNYYNRDGSFGAMCGNGSRCIAMFAYNNGIVKEKIFYLEAVDDLYKAEIIDDDNVKVSFSPPKEIKTDVRIEADINSQHAKLDISYVNVGSDHAVIFLDNDTNRGAFGLKQLADIDVNANGWIIRRHEEFEPRGVNVNFVLPLGDNKIQVRTYERGVERETLACGTGVISSAIISCLKNKANPPVKVLVQSNEWLEVGLKADGNNITDVYLTGPAIRIE